MERRHSIAVTLIEAMLILTLFAILAALSSQSFWKTAEKAKEDSAWTTLRLIDAAAKAYYRDTATWPTAISGGATALVDNGYLEDPNVGQPDWTYSLQPGGGVRYAEADRLGGSCATGFLRRWFRDGAGGTDGDEKDTLPGCP